MIDAILFDLDGTILDTLADLTDAVNYAKCEYGYKPNTISDTRMMIGNGIRNFIERSVNHDLTHIEEISDRFKLYYKDNCNNKTKPYDGIYDVLNYLKSKKIKMGVVSNKAIYATSILIDSHFEGYFDIVLGDGMEMPKKPDPTIIKYACERLNARIENTIYIGDSDVDIKTINNSGCIGMIVSYGFRDKNELLKLIDKTYDSPKELLSTLLNKIENE